MKALKTCGCYMGMDTWDERTGEVMRECDRCRGMAVVIDPLTEDDTTTLARQALVLWLQDVTMPDDLSNAADNLIGMIDEWRISQLVAHWEDMQEG